MKRGVLIMAAVLLAGASVSNGQTVTTSHGSKFEWPPVRLLVISSPTAGVEVYRFLEERTKAGVEAMNGQEQSFTPDEAVSWVASAESSLADTLRFHPATLMAHDSSTLVVARGRPGSLSGDTAFLAYYPRPDTADPKPVDIQLTVSQMTAFLNAVRTRALESHYDPAVPPDTSTAAFLELFNPRPEVISASPLRYPDELRERGIEGQVVFRAMVDTLGHVEPGSITVVSSTNPGFVPVAKATLLKTVFRPARLNGRAIRTSVVIPFNFTLGHQ